MRSFNLFSKTAIAVSLAALSFSAFADASSSDLSGFNPAQQSQIKDYVNATVPKVIMSQPKIVIDAAKEFQDQQQQDQVKSAKTVILAKIDDVLRDKQSPVYNPQGTTTLVEFFDYQCSVCHMMYPVINQVAKQFPNLRIVYKDLPIFGPASVYAAKGSFAAYAQSPELYLAYHDALFTSTKMEGQLKNSDVDLMAKKAGLNMPAFFKAIHSAQASQAIEDNTELAQALQLQGTPAIIIAPTAATSSTSSDKIVFIPGGARPEQLAQAVQMVDQGS
jgi:protein-disulfide isomerase